MRGKISAIILLAFLCLAQAALGADLKILTPSPRTKTYQEVVVLKGQGSGLKEVSLNNIKLDLDQEGAFWCGLLPKPGKNYVQIKALGKRGEKKYQYLKVLRMQTYNDLSAKHWAIHDISGLATLKIIEGYPDGSFYPASNISRGELATWIVRAAGLKVKPLDKDLCQDVPREHWRAPYIKVALQKGYMRKLSANVFGIDQKINRAEAAQAVARVSNKKEGKASEAFLDVPKNHPYFEAIAYAKRKGLIKGISNKAPLFDPDRGMSRAEAATLISRLEKPQFQEQWLFDYGQGYSKKTFCKINTPPFFLALNAEPSVLTLGKSEIMNLKAKVNDKEGLGNILNVKINLAALNGLQDAEMFDNGKNGDAVKNDGEYTLQLLISPSSFGEKKLTATVTDKIGWESVKDVVITVLE